MTAARPLAARAMAEPPSLSLLRPLFRISGLHKSFGANAVVTDLSLQIAPGECLGVIGPNGAGKTTTLRMALGLTAPDSGHIEAFGLPIPAQVREAKKRIGVVTQLDSLDPDFTCAENLRVYGRYFGLPRAVIEERIRSCWRSPPCRPGPAPNPPSCRAA
jgi:lipooligosaccharide transport system ATP-binding protein